MTITMAAGVNRLAVGRWAYSRRREGFTLVELMISVAILVAVVAAVLSFFVSFTETGVRMGFYSALEHQNQKIYQNLSQDLRDAESIVWESGNAMVLSSKGIETAYSFDAEEGTLSRRSGEEDGVVLAEDLAEFSFSAFDANGDAIDIDESLSNANTKTKMVGVSGKAVKKREGLVKSSSEIQSAVFVLRNKGNDAP